MQDNATYPLYRSEWQRARRPHYREYILEDVLLTDETATQETPPDAPAPEAEAAQDVPETETSTDSSANQWCMFMHFSLLAGAQSFLAPA